MDILKVIACLMHYPNADLQKNKGELAMVISRAREISPDQRADLLAIVDEIYGGELMDAEENYGILFDQGRSMSLHLFEHVHGESRDRGQAMVDLMNVYETNGFEMNSRELPDYIPLYLEYLARRPEMEAREWLCDVHHILARIGARLEERESCYSHLFGALLTIAGQPNAMDAERVEVAKEVPDNTLEAIDKEWEEVAVTWGSDNLSCPSIEQRKETDPNLAQPVHIQDMKQYNAIQEGARS